MITVNYSSVDGTSIKKSYKTIANAAKFARKWVGDRPEIGSRYAASGDGVGKITVQGCSIIELFTLELPKTAKLWILSYEDGASVGIFTKSHGGVGNGPRWFFARGCYVAGPNGRDYFKAVPGSVRMLDYAKGEAEAEFDRIKAIDASAERAKAVRTARRLH
jgi:hypothetical protein